MCPHVSNPFRVLALLSGLTLIWTFVGVFYHIVDIVGGVAWLAGTVSAAFLLATVSARRLSPRAASSVGVALFAAGGGLYLLLAQTPSGQVFTVEFVTGQVTYLMGTSVLQFVQVDLWAVAVAPAPVFLTWYAVVRRQYDRGALVGGATLGYFVLTGDAAWSTTLAGSLSALGVLGLGALEKAGGSWKQVERLGMVFVVATLASRAVRGVELETPMRAGGDDEWRTGTVESSLTESDRHVRVFDEVTLSSARRFTVVTDVSAYWHVASYDRYTGRGWFLAGPTAASTEALPEPPGETVTVEQTFRAEGVAETMPAAWKPTQVSGGMAENVRISSTEALVPARPLAEGDQYTVVSQVPAVTEEQLRAAGTSSPERIRDRYLQLPESTPLRVGRKAREIAADAATAYDAVRAVEAWLEANKAYSLDAGRPDGDVTDAFVFEMDQGYCVYYATAMTVLLRTLDIPARFAHGYLPGERTADDTWVVRGLDAHAWTEVHFAGVGWVPFDPTPSEPRAAAERARLAEARSPGVVDVDMDGFAPGSSPGPDNLTGIRGRSSPLATTTRSTTPASDAASGMPTSARGDLSGASSHVDRLSTTVSRMDRLTLLATVTGIALGIRRLDLLERGYRAVWLRRQPRTDSPRADVERAFERLEYLLERRHRPRATGETPQQYLAALDSEVDPRSHRVRELYERAHYGGRISRDDADEAIQLVDELVGARD